MSFLMAQDVTFIATCPQKAGRLFRHCKASASLFVFPHSHPLLLFQGGYVLPGASLFDPWLQKQSHLKQMQKVMKRKGELVTQSPAGGRGCTRACFVLARSPLVAAPSPSALFTAGPGGGPRAEEPSHDLAEELMLLNCGVGEDS